MSAIDKKIEAVDFLLASFFIHPNDEVMREMMARDKCAKNDSVAIYARMSEVELKQQLVILQNQRSGE